MNWAVGREYLDRTPFRRGTETLIRKLYEDNQRRRRLTEAEEAKLLSAAAPMLRSMIIAALDTGMPARYPAWRAKCRLANALPDPVFRYVSKRQASCSLGNSRTTTKDQGRCSHV
jgi:hypothetical protein